MPRQAPNSVDAQIGRRLRELRRSRKLSQSEIGAIVGIEYQQVQKIERGANRMPASQMFAIAEDLGVPLAYFFPEPHKMPKRTRARTDPEAEAADMFAKTTKGVKSVVNTLTIGPKK